MSKNKQPKGFDNKQSIDIPFIHIFEKKVKTSTTKKYKIKQLKIAIPEKDKTEKIKVSKKIREKYSFLKDKIDENKDWSESHSINPEYWEPINRKSSLGWIEKIFGRYRIKTQLKDIDDAEINPSVKLFTHQKFLKNYLQPISPYRGLLLFHGLGSGKTCSSIAIAEGLKKYYPICVLTPKSLQLNYKDELKKCGNVLYQLNQFWEFTELDISNKSEVKYISYLFKVSEKLITTNGGVWINSMNEASNYDVLNDIERKQINNQIDEQIDKDYEFIAYNGLRMDKLQKMINNSEDGNMFSNKVVIVDEVHNLISTIVNNRNIGQLIYKQLLEAKNVKIVLLTGTPIINYPHEISIISNILRGLMKQYTLTLSNTKGQFDSKKIENILKQIDTIDQYDVESRDSTIKITRNIYLYSNKYSEDKMEYLGIYQHNNEMEENEWLDMIKSKLEDNNYVIKNINIDTYKALPEKKEDFEKYFIDTELNQVKNHILFKKRVAGIISYYSGASKEYYPEIKNKHILEVPLSDYQFKKYESARNEERKLESNKPKKYKKDDESNSSYYRVFSRCVGNFAFPNSIKRPFTQKLHDMDKMDDADIEDDEEDDNFDTVKMKAWEKLVNNKNKYLSLDSLEKYSPKINTMVKNIIESPGNVFIYSQFKTLEGINTIALSLSANGYAKLNIVKNKGGEYIVEYDNEADKDKPKYIVFDGTDEMKRIILNIFNNNLSKLPVSLKETLLEKSYQLNNLRGELLKVILATSSGAEGIHLENIRQVHITEPYWNPVRIEQVIGRAVRYKSHINLEKSERNVEIFIYVSVFTDEQIKDASHALKLKDKNPVHNDINMIQALNPNKYPYVTSDQVIYNIASNKEKLTNEFFGLIKESAVDCNLNAVQNDDINCFGYGSKVSRNDYSFIPNIDMDEGSAYIQSQQKQIKINGQKISYRASEDELPEVYILSDEGLVYDYDCWVGDDGYGSRAVLVGKAIDVGSKKKIEFLK